MNKYNNVMNRVRVYPVKTQEFIELNRVQIDSLENAIGHKLPEDYAHFLLKYGVSAGDGDVRYGDINDPLKSSSPVEVFYGIKTGDTYDLYQKKSGFGDRLPSRLLPIASSPGGQICISLAGDDFGCIYWWDQHGVSANPMDDCELIGSSFDTFITSLCLVDE
ncbi:MAG: SMI1/KNR4 family protein [Bacteroidales bacterium]|nr:SMI1/KNR4 family protein [Bacteroidales bacterium]